MKNGGRADRQNPGIPAVAYSPMMSGLLRLPRSSAYMHTQWLEPHFGIAPHDPARETALRVSSRKTPEPGVDIVRCQTVELRFFTAKAKRGPH